MSSISNLTPQQLNELVHAVRRVLRLQERQREIIRRRNGITRVRGWINVHRQNLARWNNIYTQRRAIFDQARQHNDNRAIRRAMYYINDAVGAMNTIQRNITRHERDATRYEEALRMFELTEQQHDMSFACYE